MRRFEDLGGGRVVLVEGTPDIWPYSQDYFKQTTNQGGTRRFADGHLTSIMTIKLPCPEPVHLAIGIDPYRNLRYMDGVPNGVGGFGVGAIYDSAAHACVAICKLKLGIEQDHLSFNFDLALGRLFRIPIVASSLEVACYVGQVPRVTDVTTISPQDFNDPVAAIGLLTPQPAPVRTPQELEVTGICGRGIGSNGKLPQLTRRGLVSLPAGTFGVLPMAWGATHVRVHGSAGSTFSFVGRRDGGAAFTVGPIPVDVTEPIEIPDNAVSVRVDNAAGAPRDFDVVYYLGF